MKSINNADYENAKPFKNQIYSNLNRQHNEHNLFEDPEFPADHSTLYFSKKSDHTNIKWKRPKEARKNPRYCVNGFNTKDLDQGSELGDCWLIAAITAIVPTQFMPNQLFHIVVPKEQGFDENYAGIFFFRFWVYGEWVSVVIDDRLPFVGDIHDEKNFTMKFLFCSDKEEQMDTIKKHELTEFWAPLLEKAYAKLYGSYEMLNGGRIQDALVDMSGGIQEIYKLRGLDLKLKSQFWTVLLQNFKKGSLMGVKAYDIQGATFKKPNGILWAHSYTITKVAEIHGYKLIRIRNPWGDGYEWKGAWSDNSVEWLKLTGIEKQMIEYNPGPEGEFWMSFEDFMKNWDELDIVHLSVDSFSTGIMETHENELLKWKCRTYFSKWEKGFSAGGCGNDDREKFWKNPQFLIRLTTVDENEDMVKVIVSLTQKDYAQKHMIEKKSKIKGVEAINAQFYKVKENVEIKENSTTGNRFTSNQLEFVGLLQKDYKFIREISGSFKVKPGSYVLIPTTFDPDCEDCEFMLRIFTEHALNDQDGNTVVYSKKRDSEILGELEASRLGLEIQTALETLKLQSAKDFLIRI